MKSIRLDELKKKLEKNNVKLIEVLEEDAYNKEHIKGAINIPLERIATEAKDRFNKDDEIVVYCSNFDCSASPTAAKKLKSIGFKNVYDYEAGKKEWKEAGLPME
ncbi:MAG TPA: rhodanese-like domain-containing protein [Bacteroidales bacterium]|jgi:rhodanese-related sulfurtransferase|nr:rhodanese-like domain-containing protein [Bacteroidales bacterium]